MSVRPGSLAALLPLVPLLLAAACQSSPVQPRITPLDVTIKLGRISEKTPVGRIDVPDGGGWGGGGAGVGFAIDLNRLLNPQPRPQIDLYRYKVTALDGTGAMVDGPAAPGLEPGACVRMIYPDGAPEPRLAPSSEC